VLAFVLGASRRQRDGGGAEIELAKEEAADLVAARSGAYQELDDRAELVSAIVGRQPNDPQLFVREYPLAPAVLVCLVGEGDRIGVEVALARASQVK
jgi:hypothetical protein